MVWNLEPHETVSHREMVCVQDAHQDHHKNVHVPKYVLLKLSFPRGFLCHSLFTQPELKTTPSRVPFDLEKTTPRRWTEIGRIH